MWLRHDHPELFNKAAKFISIKEYVLAKLFNDYVIDHSIASATGMLNLANLDWDEEALQLAGITPDRLSRLVPTTYKLEGLNPDIRLGNGTFFDRPYSLSGQAMGYCPIWASMR